MPGRIRTVKPEWMDDQRLAHASSDARVMSICLILLADDYGNGRCVPMDIGPRVFPVSCVSLESLLRISKMTHAVLCELTEIKYSAMYEVDGQTYFNIRNWNKHQKVNHPGKPLVPSPPDDLWSRPIESLKRLARDPSELLLPDHDHDHDHDQEKEEASPPPAQKPVVKRPDPTRAQLEGSQPGQRSEVVQVHELWKSTFGKEGSKIGNPNGELAMLIRDAVHDYGLSDCLAVVKQAPSDGMVTGKDDENGKRHDDLFYILKPKTFDRLLVASKTPAPVKRRELTATELKQLGRG